MTSGTLTDEPICFEDADARSRLGAIADAWLSHDRPIHVPCDDSVLQVDPETGDELPLRRSRVTLPPRARLPFAGPPTLAVGGEPENVRPRLGARRLRATASTSATEGSLGDVGGLRALHPPDRRPLRGRGHAGGDGRAPGLPDPALGRVQREKRPRIFHDRPGGGPAPSRARRVGHGRARGPARAAGHRRRLRRHRLRRRRDDLGRRDPRRRLPRGRAGRLLASGASRGSDARQAAGAMSPGARWATCPRRASSGRTTWRRWTHSDRTSAPCWNANSPVRSAACRHRAWDACSTR